MNMYERREIEIKPTFVNRAIKLVNLLMDLVFERIEKGFLEKSYLNDNKR